MKTALGLLCLLALEGRPTSTTVSLGFAAYSSDPSIGFGETARTRIDAIWIGMQDAQVRPASSCKRADAKPVVAGSFTVELVKARRLDSAKLAAARYCAFEVQLRPMRGKVSGEHRGASIVVHGRRGDGTRFVVRSRIETLPFLRATDLQGFAVAGASTRWILGVDVARWFAGVDLALAERSETARDIAIDDTSNRDLLAAFEASVDAGFALFPDANGDRTLDAGERKRPLAARDRR